MELPGILIFACFCATVWGFWFAGSTHLQPTIKVWYFRNVIAGAMSIFLGLIVVMLMYSGWFGVVVGLAITVGSAFAPARQKRKLTLNKTL